MKDKCFDPYLSPVVANYKLLEFQSLHDKLLMSGVFYVLIVQGHFIVGLCVYLIPAVEYVIAYSRSEKVDKDEPDYILEGIQHQIPIHFRKPATSSSNTCSFVTIVSNFLEPIRRKLPAHLKKQNNKSSRAYSLALPFCNSNMVIFSTSDYKKIAISDVSDDFKAVVTHEIGHLVSYDRNVYRWYQWSIIVFCVYFLMRVYQQFKYNILSSEDFSLPSLYSSLFFLMVMCFMYSFRYRILHRGEYRADFFAYHFLPIPLLKFLENSFRVEKRIRNRTKNTLSHPDFSMRIGVFEGLSLDITKTLKESSFIWFFYTFYIIFSPVDFDGSPFNFTLDNFLLFVFATCSAQLYLAQRPIINIEVAIKYYFVGVFSALLLLLSLNLFFKAITGLYYVESLMLFLYLAITNVAMYFIAMRIAVQRQINMIV